MKFKREGPKVLSPYLWNQGPHYEQGDMWSQWEHTDLFLITTNSTVTQGGRLVMGAGIARQARDRFPGVELALGKKVHEYGSNPYGLLVSERWPAARLGAFQTKRHWREPADEELIKLGVEKLYAWCRRNMLARVDLNLPGVGLGRLEPTRVKALLGPLPSTVHIWSYPSR